MSLQKKTFSLNPQGVDELAEEVGQFLESLKIPGRDSLRTRLAAEETALRSMEQPDAPETITLSTGKRFGRVVLSLSYPGKPFDPTVSSADPEDWSGTILKNLGLEPTWSYRGGVNTVFFHPPKGESTGKPLRILVFAAVTVALGALGLSLPEEARDGLNQLLLTPIMGAFMGLLNTFAGLVVFTSVTASVFGIGDTSSLNRIGKALLLRIFLTIFSLSVFCVLAVLPFLRLSYAESAGGASQMSEISEMIFNILPKNPVQPFLDGNMIQIIVLAVFTGVAILIVGERALNVRALIEECSNLLQVLMGQVCRLIPIFVAASLLSQLFSGNIGDLLSLWKPLLLLLLLSIPMTLLLLLDTCLRTRTAPIPLLRKITPPALIACATASSMSVYSTLAEICQKRLGVNKQLVHFALPVGLVAFMPMAVIAFVAVPVCLAELYGVEVNLSWFVMLGFLSALLSIATPPLPGANLICYGLLLTQLNIPAEALVLAVALDVINDHIETGIDILVMPLFLTSLGDTLGMVDRERLHSN